jgi:hypothetical protein
MRRTFSLLAILGLGCLSAVGCAEKAKRGMIRLPKEDFHKPPANLFAGGVQYPDGVLNNVKPRAPKDDKGAPPQGWDNQGPTMGGAGLGMNGPGGR